MNAEQKKSIKSTILECRDILEKDIEQVLINYGVYVDKDWVNIRDLKNLSEEQEKNRKNIEAVIEKLQKGGFDKSKAVIEYIKEVSYTYLNRLAALRVMEVRGLTDEILIPRGEYGNKSFIGSRFYEVAREYCKFEMDGGLAYLLNIMFEEISEEIKMLFNTEDEYSFVSPTSTNLLKIIDLLCTNIDQESWIQDEIIGWIYQYFIEKEKKDTFKRASNESGEYGAHEVPAVTQFFTPDWIVNWIADNTLENLFNEINQEKNEGKQVEEIKLLDPCCGSGHFLVKAYDLFYKMYLEEGVYSEEEIPYKILQNNIYGIDIDLRAVQLSGLILFIKTKTYLKSNGYDINTKDKLLVNLVCADAILLNGDRLKLLKEKHKGNKTVLKMLEIIYAEFEDMKLKGSLIQPEKHIFPLFEEFKHRIAKRELSKAKRNKKKLPKGQDVFLDEDLISLEEYKSKRDFTKEEKELMDSLISIYHEAIKANDISRQMFANEAVKSIKLVDIFMKQYDIVITNPPFMGRKYMNSRLKTFIDIVYKDTKNDLYSVFIERCISLTKQNGFIGMITQNSFMFIKTYEKVRNLILNNTVIEQLAHLGPRAFDDISGEKVNTTMFILKKSNNVQGHTGMYIKLDDIKNATKKRKIMEQVIKGEVPSRVFYNNQNDFKFIEGRAFVYWISDELKELFEKYKPLKKYAKTAVGFQSGKDPAFFRFFWEVTKESIGKKWFKCAKGGGYGRYYKSLPQVVLWENNGQEIKKYKGSVIRNEDYYFKKGINSSLLGGINYSSRILPEDYMFNVASVSVFPHKEEEMNFFLGLLNSSLSVYLLNCINPTNNIPPGTLDKLPVKTENSYYKFQIEELTKKCIESQCRLITTDETSNIFEKPFLNNYGNNDLRDILVSEIIEEYKINKEIDISNIIIDEHVFNYYEISQTERIHILKELKRIKYKDEYRDTYESNMDLESTILDKIEKKLSKSTPVYKIAYEEKLDIMDVYNYLITNKVYSKEQLITKLKSIISYYIGVIFSRWENQPDNNDGIIPMNSSIYLEKDIIEKLYEAFTLDFNEDIADRNISYIEKILERDLSTYFIKEFFEEHCKIYQNRPIYWHICSPNKTFNCFVYYHKLDNDTLYKVKSIYLGQMIDRYQEDLKYYTEQLIEARVNGEKSKEKDFRDKCSDLETKLEDLNLLDKKIMEILPYKPDIDQGVLHNIIPLEPILSSIASTKKEREDYYKEVGK